MYLTSAALFEYDNTIEKTEPELVLDWVNNCLYSPWKPDTIGYRVWFLIVCIYWLGLLGLKGRWLSNCLGSSAWTCD